MHRVLSLLVAASLAATPAFAGKDPCKGVKAKGDAFGMTRSYEAGDLKLRKMTTDTGSTWAMTLGFNQGGGYGAFSALSMEVLPEGTVIEVLMEDGSKVELLTSAAAGSQQVSIMGIMVSHYDLPITLEEAQVKALSSQPLKAFRVMKGAEAWKTDEFKKGDAQKFSDTAACMLGS